MWSVGTPDVVVVVGGVVVAKYAGRSSDDGDGGDLILLCSNGRAAPSVREKENDMATRFAAISHDRGEREENARRATKPGEKTRLHRPHSWGRKGLISRGHQNPGGASLPQTQFVYLR